MWDKESGVQGLQVWASLLGLGGRKAVRMVKDPWSPLLVGAPLS